ncbi:MAG: hypothetical protein ACXWIN_03245 [Burkholderiaceae bacterium]
MIEPKKLESPLIKISRLCLLSRTGQGLKIDPVRFLQDSSYAKARLAELQTHEKMNDELLALCIDLSLWLAVEKTEGPDPVDPPPPAGKNYKFGPRG